MSKESLLSKIDFIRSKPQLIILALFASGALVLAWVGLLTWTDISTWNKDIGAVFFGSRTGEAISLGIGMVVIHYFLIGVSLLGAGVVLFLRNRILTTDPQQAMIMKAQKMNAKNQSNPVKSQARYAKTEESAAASEERFFSGCLHHFGYLSSRPKDSPIPQECIICQRLGDCMVATVYVTKVND
ncbi:MAG: hypothetical protein NWF06_06875 [Candidatus Bathyarchaeota archaeon]|nr:hypothetical protein [Candidatus Bathyarchaeum sp.]